MNPQAVIIHTTISGSRHHQHGDDWIPFPKTLVSNICRFAKYVYIYYEWIRVYCNQKIFKILILTNVRAGPSV